MDLWAEMYLLDRGQRLGTTITSYRDTYFSPGRRNGHIVYEWKLNAGAEEEIWKRLEDVTVSMKAVDWLRMPSRLDLYRYAIMDQKARKEYDRLMREKVLPMTTGEGIVAETAAALSGKLLQMANGAVYDGEREEHHIHDAKLDVLDEIIDEAQVDTLLVFYGYKHDKRRILERHPEAIELSS
jgi:hypothetical protein